MYEQKTETKKKWILPFILSFFALLIIAAISSAIAGTLYRNNCDSYKNVKSFDISGFKFDCSSDENITGTQDFLLTEITSEDKYIFIKGINVEGNTIDLKFPKSLNKDFEISIFQENFPVTLEITQKRLEFFTSVKLSVEKFFKLQNTDPEPVLKSWELNNRTSVDSSNNTELVKQLVKWIRKLNTDNDLHPLSLLLYEEKDGKRIFVSIQDKEIVSENLVGRYFVKTISTLATVSKIYDLESKKDLMEYIKVELDGQKNFDIAKNGGANCNDVFSMIENVNTCGTDCTDILGENWKENISKWCDDTLYSSYEKNWKDDKEKLMELSTLLDGKIVLSSTSTMSGFAGGENVVRLNSDVLLGMPAWILNKREKFTEEDLTFLKNAYRNLVYTWGLSSEKDSEIYHLGIVAQEFYSQTGDTYYKKDVQNIFEYTEKKKLQNELDSLENINYIASLRFFSELDSDNYDSFVKEKIFRLLNRSWNLKYGALYSYVPKGFEFEYSLLDQVELINLLDMD
ncbi:MAG: hypothetical protein AB9915_03550 [Candidatus Dojkabacteria bacterium]